MRNLPQVPVNSRYFPMKGGFDQTTPTLTVDPGSLRDTLNFECGISGGYDRIVGYERFDGRDSPSDATYSTLPATVTGSWSNGDTITGVTSGATAVALTTNDNGFIVTKVVGTFQNAENLQISAVTIATCDGENYTGGAATSKLDAQYLNLAADEYRSDIAAIPGSGPVRGVWVYDDVTYGFRDNVGATACDMYKSTTSGWSSVALGRQVSFTSGGTYEIVEGDTITGATSGATAVITRVVLTSGSWAAGTAAGKLIFASQTGTFQAENLNVGATLNVATIAGNSSAITLSPGGRFEFDNVNFGGSANEKRMYGCDGVNKAFEFDGTVFVPIDTGMSVDTPNFIVGHKNHLFLAFGASVQHSGIGTPYVWSVVTGAAEIAAGDDVTCFKPLIGNDNNGALLVTTRGQAFILYGSSSSDWNFVSTQSSAGAFAYSVQDVGVVMMLDDRGITQLGATQAFGNFEQATVSEKIRPWIRQYKKKIHASCVVREKNQYRLFFTDNYALYITMKGRKLVGMMPVLFNDKVECICSSEFSDGSERMFFGSTDGVVYEMDKGTSFDGDAINFWATLHFNHVGSPQVRKRWRKLSLEVSGSSYSEFDVGYQLSYNSSEVIQPESTSIEASLTTSVWDSFVWDNFIWDGQTLIPAEMSIDGTAENIALAINGSSDYVNQFSVTGVTYQHTTRGRVR